MFHSDYPFMTFNRDKDKGIPGTVVLLFLLEEIRILASIQENTSFQMCNRTK